MKHNITVALAGNPNCGKTVLFNALTGSQQRIGNWPGVTVDRRTGWFKTAQHPFTIVDLPGVYTATHHNDALDEKIVCDYFKTETPDIIINVIDASNLQRNLYLTLQLLELQIPMIVVVNMMDITEKRGITIDTHTLSAQLQCPIVTTIARQGKGISHLKKALSTLADSLPTSATPQSSSSDSHTQRYENTHLAQPIQEAMNAITQQFITHGNMPTAQAAYFTMSLLEGHKIELEQHIDSATQQRIQRRIATLQQNYTEDLDIMIADQRYQFINRLCDQITELKPSKKATLTQRIDRIILHRYLGIPIFLAIMYCMFFFAINVGGAFQDLFDISSSTLFIDGTAHLLTIAHSPTWLTAIAANGIGTGINTVVTFIPVIAAMFLFLAFLEDSGYMTRAAFVMDKFMRTLGLSGKSFVPMIVGFGCNVPAIMGARTLSHRRDRILTVLMMPFMACSARLAIFAVFISAFFPIHGALVIFALYIFGIIMAIISGLILRKSVLQGSTEPLMMELPPYHLPLINTLLRQAWWRLKHFLSRAGKAIIPICVLIGSLNAITVSGELKPEGSQQSLLSAAGRALTPLFTPMGIQQDNWPATVGLASGILAKEVVIGTLNTLYSQSASVSHPSTSVHFMQNMKAALQSVPANFAALGSAFINPIAANEAPHDMSKTAFGTMIQRFASAQAALAYLVFVLLYFPCVATMAAIRREIGKAWAYFSVIWNTASAYALSVLCYQLLSLPQHPVSALLWIAGMSALLISGFMAMRIYAYKNKNKVIMGTSMTPSLHTAKKAQG